MLVAITVATCGFARVGTGLVDDMARNADNVMVGAEVLVQREVPVANSVRTSGAVVKPSLPAKTITGRMLHSPPCSRPSR